MNIEEGDCHVSFMHLPGPNGNFIMPVRKDLCWVPFEDVISKIAAPVTATGRTYNISREDELFITRAVRN